MRHVLPQVAQHARSARGLPRQVLKVMFDCEESPCRITSGGGNMYAFALAGKAATLHPNMSFIVSGPCLSGCTIFADIARDRLCFDHNAKFGFHKGRRWDPGNEYPSWFVPPYSAGVEAWTTKVGMTEEIRVMPWSEAAKHWRPCDFHPPMPLADPRKKVVAAR